MATDREAAIDALFAAPPVEFVAERKRLAAELRAAKDREAAAEIAKWPKPTAPAWALNALVRDGDEAVAAWLAAADALRDASTGGGGDLRAAMAAHRDATVALVDAASARAELSGAMRERVRGLLQTATADEELVEALRTGRISEPGTGDDAEPAPAAPAKPEKSAKREKAAKSKAPAKPKPDRAAEKREQEAEAKRERERAAAAERERRAEEAAAEADRRRAEADEAASAATAAEERHEEAERALRRARSERDAARTAAKDADRSLAQAERLLEKLRPDLS